MIDNAVVVSLFTALAIVLALVFWAKNPDAQSPPVILAVAGTVFLIYFIITIIKIKNIGNNRGL